MSELRKNPFTGEWTLYAKTRKKKPYEFQWTKPTHKKDCTCPFCYGQESQTTEAVYQDGENEAWNIRVFPNMYPAIDMTQNKTPIESFYEQHCAGGFHEVLVDTPIHAQTVDQFSLTQLQQVLYVLQLRQKEFLAQKEIVYVQIFKNCGAGAGMSIQHSHWQLIGLPMVPERIRKMTELGMANGCKFCEMIQYEQKQNTRIVAENENFIAITPYGSRFAYEVWILPKIHVTSFDMLSMEQIETLSALLQPILQAMMCLQQELSYNICFMEAEKGRDFHWHIQLLPRIGGFAGFEHATDCFINTVKPEEAAQYYRKNIKK